MKIWLHDHLVDPRDAMVSILDHGFTVGDGVFETLAVRDGTPFALSRHLERLTHSARGMGLPLPDLDRVRESIDAVLAQEPITWGRLRLTWTSGVGALGSGRDGAQPTLAVVATEATPWPATAALALVPWPRNERSPIAGLKTTSYAENVVALAHARALGADEALFCNVAGHVCEGASTNVIVAMAGELVTPPLTAGCLAGITRALALQWCGVREADLSVDDLLGADEVLITSSTRDLHPVDTLIVAGTTVRLEAPGPLSRAAMATYSAQAALSPDP